MIFENYFAEDKIDENKWNNRPLRSILQPQSTRIYGRKFLHNKAFQLHAVAQKKGQLDGLAIHDTSNPPEHADTISVFLNPDRQKNYYDYILNLHPKRIIFNPGTENPELIELATQRNIQIIKGCTIAMLMNGVL